jgi:hypothetical protein
MSQPNKNVQVGGASDQVYHHWSEFFLKVKHQFHMSILVLN